MEASRQACGICVIKWVSLTFLGLGCPGSLLSGELVTDGSVRDGGGFRPRRPCRHTGEPPEESRPRWLPNLLAVPSLWDVLFTFRLQLVLNKDSLNSCGVPRCITGPSTSSLYADVFQNSSNKFSRSLGNPSAYSAAHQTCYSRIVPDN